MPLAVEGVGTSHVESFASFLHRLADRHGVGHFQLVRLLGAGQTPGAFSLSSTERLRQLNASPKIDLLVAGLNTALDRGDIRATTLRALSTAFPGDGMFIAKKTRAWCPACFFEALAYQNTVYDRLIWNVALVWKCPFHCIRLMTRCPSCLSLQLTYSVRRAMDQCIRCAASLIPPKTSWGREPLVTSDEEDIELIEVIAWMANHPTTSFSTHLLAKVVQQHPEIVELSRRANRFRPHRLWALADASHEVLTLQSLSALSRHLRCSLLSLLRAPETTEPSIFH